MSPALRFLIRLHFRALFRRLVRGVRTPRGLVFILVAGAFLSFAAFGQFAASERNASRGPAPAFVDTREGTSFRRFGPVGLCALTLLSVFASSRNRGVVFSAAEVDNLFPAPFTRRQLIAYRVAYQVLQTALSAAFMCLFLGFHFHNLAQAFIGIFMLFTFLGLAQQTTSLLAGAVEARALRLSRRVLGGVLLAVAIAVVVGLGSLTHGDATLLGRAGALLDHPVVRWLLFPFRVFSEVLGAPTLPAFLGWGAAGAALIAALFAVLLLLDVDYREAALETSERLYERLQKVRRGRLTSSSSRKLQIAIRPFPRLGGAGTIAWRQLQELVRESPAAVYIFFIFALGALVPSLVVSASGSSLSAGNLISSMVLPLTIVCPFILSNWFQFDFRGDLDRFETLLCLPLRPRAIALGQVLAPAVAISIVQAVGLIAVARLGTEPWHDVVGLGGLVLCVPVNVLFVCLENFFFLVAPTRTVPGAFGDFQHMGRFMLLFFIKFVTLVALAAAGAGIGAIAHLLTGSGALTVLAILVYALAIDAAALAAVSWAFARFDISRVPPE